MIERIEGIVIDLVRHNDRHNVVTLYTRSRGRMAFLVPVGKSKQGKMRNASLSMMACVGAQINYHDGKELMHLRQIEPVRLWHNIYFNPLKSSVLFFLSEFSSRLLRQSPPDERLYDFILDSLEVLDALQPERVANFHIAFLVRMLPMAGIWPSVEGREDGEQFDMLSGTMVDPRMQFGRRQMLLDERASALVPKLLKINFRNMHRFRFRGSERSETLETIIRYYSQHLPIGGELKSLKVLKELFA